MKSAEEQLGQVETIAAMIARRLPRRAGIDVRDLAQDGCVGLVRARAKYDETRGIQFDLFAKRYIKGAILDGLRAMSPLTRGLLVFKRRMQEASEKLFSQRGVAPSEGELAGELGITIGEFRRETDAIRVSESTPVDALPDRRSPSPFDIACRKERADQIRRAFRVLTPKERAAIRLRYLEEVEFTQDEIAEAIGASQSGTCYILQSAIAKLRRELGQE